jgi:GMP synthase (glutamine-hydrolysing)
MHALKELGGYECRILSFSEISQQNIPPNLEAIILSGSSALLSKQGEQRKYKAEVELITQSNKPILGICFGHQLIATAFGSKIIHGKKIEDFQKIKILENDEIFACWESGEEISLCQNHRDYVKRIPNDFICLAESKTCIEAMKHKDRPVYGVQAHIERTDDKNPGGLQVLQNFIFNVVDNKSESCDRRTET